MKTWKVFVTREERFNIGLCGNQINPPSIVPAGQYTITCSLHCMFVNVPYGLHTKTLSSLMGQLCYILYSSKRYPQLLFTSTDNILYTHHVVSYTCISIQQLTMKARVCDWLESIVEIICNQAICFCTLSHFMHMLTPLANCHSDWEQLPCQAHI